MPKSRSQRRREQPRPRRRRDEGERLDLHDMRPRRRPLADDDVELVVLERRVELLFEHRLQAMDLIQKQHLPLAQVGQDRSQVALDLQRRPGCLLKPDIQLIGDDRGQRRLAQSWRPEKQHMVQRLAARLGRLQRDRQLLFRLRLANELTQHPRPKLEFKGILLIGPRRGDEAFEIGFSRRHLQGSLERIPRASRRREDCQRFC